MCSTVNLNLSWDVVFKLYVVKNYGTNKNKKYGLG